MSDDDKKIEDMSLADLLSMGGGEPQRTQERDDEPGSGIAKLAQMVAASSVADAKRPSFGPGAPPSGATMPMYATGGSPPMMGSVPPPPGSIPPPPSSSISPPGGSVPLSSTAPPTGAVPSTESVPPYMPPVEGSMPPGAAMQPTEAMPAMGSVLGAQAMSSTAGMPAYAQTDMDSTPTPGKKSNVTVIAAVGALVVAGIIAAFVLLQGSETKGEDNGQLAALETQLQELKSAKEKLAEAEKIAVAAAAEAEAAKTAAAA